MSMGAKTLLPRVLRFHYFLNIVVQALTNYCQEISNVKYQPATNEHGQNSQPGISHFVFKPVIVSG